MKEDQKPAVTVTLAESILKEAGEQGLPMKDLKAAMIERAGDSEQHQYDVNWVVRNMIRTGSARFGKNANLILPAFHDLAQIP